MRLSEATVIVEDVFRQLDVPQLIYKVGVEWNSRFRVKMGQATYRRYLGDGKIELSSTLFAKANYEEQYETVVHEACHIADAVLGSKMGHSKTWKALMIKCGIVDPQRCHTVPVEQQRRTRVACVCGCGPNYIGAIRAKKIMELRSKYRCLICKQTIILV